LSSDMPVCPKRQSAPASKRTSFVFIFFLSFVERWL
jgi:hypothetical protein